MKSKLFLGSAFGIAALAVSAQAQFIITDGSTNTITFDESIGWQAGNDNFYDGSVLHATPNASNDGANWATPGNGGFQDPSGNTAFSSAAWAYFNQNVTNPRTSFANPGSPSNANKWFQVQFVDSAVHPVLTSRALQYTGDTSADRDLTLRIRNSTGSAVTSWNLGFDLSTYGNFGTATFSLLSSTDNINFTPSSISVALTNGAGPTTVTSLGTQSAVINATVANNDYLYVRYNYIRTTSGNGALLDNLTIQAVPEPATWALLAGGLTTLVVFRRRKA